MKDSGKFKNCEEGQSYSGKVYSRRAFLKVASVAGAAVAAGAGLGGLAASCGGATATTTASAAASTTTTAAASSTSVSASATTGREIKLGFVTPQTGSLASFGGPDKYVVDRWKSAIGDGVVLGDGKKHPTTFLLRDSQSNSNRAAQVAGDLIQNDRIDMMLVASSPDTVNPVADQCEAQGTPCLSNDSPMEAYYYGRGATPDKPFKWTWHCFWGNSELKALSPKLWALTPTNKKIGGLWSNDTNGNARRDLLTPLIPAEGFTLVDGGPYQPGTEDYTSVISLFRKEGCEILNFLGTPPDFANFWKQCLQQGFRPKLPEISMASLFPESMEAVGEIAYNVCNQSWWHPLYPFHSSLTGETCSELALDYEKTTGRQWSQPLMHYQTLEWAVDVLKRTTNVDDKEEIIRNVATTNMKDSLAGPIDFTAPVKPQTPHPVLNVVSTPTFEAQWVRGTEQYPWEIKLWPWDLKCILNDTAPQMPIQAQIAPMEY